MIAYLPLLFGLALGFLFGRYVGRIDHPATILASGLLLSLLLGPLPFYGDTYGGLPVAGVYLAAIVGVILGSEVKSIR